MRWRTYTASDNVTYYVGWTLGWDTGYDQFGDGNNFLGGVAVKLNDCVKYTYLCTAGDLGWRGDGYSHSNVARRHAEQKWQYVFQSDLLDTDGNSAIRGRSELWREQLLVLHDQRLLEVGYAC